MSICFKALTNLLDLVPKSLHSSILTSEVVIFIDAIST